MLLVQVSENEMRVGRMPAGTAMVALPAAHVPWSGSGLPADCTSLYIAGIIAFLCTTFSDNEYSPSGYLLRKYL